MTVFAKRLQNDSFETPTLSAVRNTTGISAVTTAALFEVFVFVDSSRGGLGVRGGRGLPSFDVERGLSWVRGLSPGRAEDEREAGPDPGFDDGPPGLRAPGLLPVLLLAAASRTSL